MVGPQLLIASPRTHEVHEALRAATATRHAEIDSLLALRRPFGRGHYARVLQGFGAFLSAWEPQVARALPAPWQPWIAASARVHLVQQDLAALGVAAMPVAPVLPALDGAPAALGSLYVLEGSALGGRFIAAEAQRHLGLTPEHGVAYFHGCGSATAARWREFLARLALDLEAPEALAQAARGATTTFDALTDTFRGALEHRERTAA